MKSSLDITRQLLLDRHRRRMNGGLTLNLDSWSLNCNIDIHNWVLDNNIYLKVSENITKATERILDKQKNRKGDRSNTC